jgi:aminoglycoside/choline kinase family phosphotransferase
MTSATQISQAPAGFDLDEKLVQNIQYRLTGVASSSEVLKWEPLCLGGSDREFYRIRSANKSWIVMHYSLTREENALYVDIADFLRRLSVNIPQILFHDSQIHWIGIEDLGDVSLHTIFHESNDSKKVDLFYQRSLEEVFKLHQQNSSPTKTMPGFDEKLYRWERQYFMEHFVAGWAKIEISESLQKEIEAEGTQMASQLELLPRCLIHRDFQSQNLMVHGEAVWLIDFQGMRLGHAAYDLASLLYDPYVSLTTKQRQENLTHYLSLNKNGSSQEAFEKSFYQASTQRLMQALGAYGFLGMVKGKKHFLQHIPSGLRNLTDAITRLGSMPRTLELVRQIGEKSDLKD